MKIRTDFVTNSSSSSFCTVNVSLKSGEDILFETDSEGAYEFAPTTGAQKKLSKIKDIQELIAFLQECETGTSEGYEDFVEDFYAKLNGVEDVEAIKSLYLGYGYFESECGSREGGGFVYDFETGTYKKDSSKYKEWLKTVREYM